MITEFGEFCRVHRIANHQVLGDQAKYLEVSCPYLSSCENGREKVPIEWVDSLAQYWNLDDSEKKELLDKINITNKTVGESTVVRDQIKNHFNGDIVIDDDIATRIATMLANKKKDDH